MRRAFDTRRAGGQSGDKPAARISDGSGTDRHRGQAHVLGLVLLIGAVAVASVGIIMLGSSGLETQQTTIEAEYAEQSLLEFAHSAETTATTGHGPSDVSFGPFDHGHVAMRDDAGRVTITRVNSSGSDEVLYDEPLGTLAYGNEDTEIAYQGGGVWRTDGAGAVMVSAPGIEYRDGTLTFPLVQLGGDRVGGNVVDGTVRQAATPTQIALDDRSGHDRGSVTGNARARSGSIDEWMVSGTVSHENYDYPSADEEIDRALEACDEFKELDEDVTEQGVHCTDEIDSGHHFDTSNGDIAVVVRKSFDLSGSDSISVTGNNDLTIYAGEDLDVKGSAVIGNASDPSQTQLVFSSGSTVETVSGSPEINALLYAPESTVDIKGTPTIVGTAVGDEVTIHDVAAEIRGDESLATLEYIPGAGPRVPYATVTAYEAELDD